MDVNAPCDHPCRYEGFLSYARADARAAAWLHRALERFRVPRRLAAELGLGSRRFKPFFRDQDELATSADLSASLVGALRESRTLIVICSSAAAASHWVDEEVRLFRELGRGRYIYCVLTEGDPNDPESVFPPSLRAGAVPLAVDLRNFRQDRHAALLRLVAALLDVRYDTLRQRERQRVRQRTVTSVAAAGAAATVIALVTYEVATVPPCRGAPDRFAEVWNDDVRGNLAAAFASTGLPYASASWERVQRRLDAYANSWIGTHTEACSATLVREEQSAELMDLRMSCLEGRRFAFSSLVTALSNADASVIERAVDATEELPNLARCSNREQLLASYPLPQEDSARARIDEIRSITTKAHTLLSTGRIDEALQLGRRASSLATEIDYPPAEAEALILRGNAEARSGAAETARATLYQATSKAVLSRDDELIARAWLALSSLLVEFGDRLDEAFEVLDVTRAYVAQQEENDALRAAFHHLRGSALVTASRLKDGIADLEVAVGLARAAQLPELPDYLNALSRALDSTHDFAGSELLAAEALSLTRLSLGRQHPKYAEALTRIGRVESALGNAQKALDYQAEAVRILQDIYTESSPEVVVALDELGWALKDTGRYSEGIEVLKRAIVIEEAFETPRLRVVASLHNGIGDIHISQGNFADAERHMQLALDAWTRQGPGTHVGVGLNNLGNLANRTGDHIAAEDYCRRALQNDLAFYAETHPDLAYPLTCLGEALLGQGRAADALEPLGRADGLRSRDDVSSAARAWTRWLYGRALAESGRDDQRGLQFVHASRDVFAGMGDSASSELADVEAWLTARQ